MVRGSVRSHRDPLLTVSRGPVSVEYHSTDAEVFDSLYLSIVALLSKVGGSANLSTYR